LHLAGEMAKQAIGQIMAFCCRSKILVFIYSYYIFLLTIRCNWEKISSALWFLVNSIFFREKKSMYNGKCCSCLGKKKIKNPPILIRITGR
jgi:hypothetical protein